MLIHITEEDIQQGLRKSLPNRSIHPPPVSTPLGPRPESVPRNQWFRFDKPTRQFIIDFDQNLPVQPFSIDTSVCQISLPTDFKINVFEEL